MSMCVCVYACFMHTCIRIFMVYQPAYFVHACLMLNRDGQHIIHRAAFIRSAQLLFLFSFLLCPFSATTTITIAVVVVCVAAVAWLLSSAL